MLLCPPRPRPRPITTKLAVQALTLHTQQKRLLLHRSVSLRLTLLPRQLQQRRRLMRTRPLALLLASQRGLGLDRGLKLLPRAALTCLRFAACRQGLAPGQAPLLPKPRQLRIRRRLVLAVPMPAALRLGLTRKCRRRRRRRQRLRHSRHLHLRAAAALPPQAPVALVAARAVRPLLLLPPAPLAQFPAALVTVPLRLLKLLRRLRQRVCPPVQLQRQHLLGLACQWLQLPLQPLACLTQLAPRKAHAAALKRRLPQPPQNRSH